MVQRKRKRLIVISLILLGAILLSLLVNLGIYVIERILYPTEYTEYVEKYAKEYNIPEYIIFSIINVESRFDEKAISTAGAVGLMQMLPSTFTWLSSLEHLNENLSPNELFKPEVSIRYGTYYLRYLFEKFYDWDLVFAAYNGGEGNVVEWLKNKEYTDRNGKLIKIPFPETEKYVKKVNRNVEYYHDTYYKD